MNSKQTLPEDYPLRLKLHNEAHARKSTVLHVPVRASHLAIMLQGEEKKQEKQHLFNLCEQFGVARPKADADHFVAGFGDFHLRWQQHGEFSTYTVFKHGEFTQPFMENAIDWLPTNWLSELQGQVIVAMHAAIMKVHKEPDIQDISNHFDGETLVGSQITGGAAFAFTDFEIYDDGFGRILVLDKNFQHWQAGRYLQRLFEIEVYRIMALLAFPVAKKLLPELNRADKELLTITEKMTKSVIDDAKLLDELTALAAEIESCFSRTHGRFNATDAYYKLVERRLEELREVRIPGVQMIGEFLNRRLEPAINTCRTAEKRISMLSERISNAGQLVRTRVDITLERQNQVLLESMDKRAQLQLHLQSTVEGLSVAAISYYMVSLVGYVMKALKAAGLPVNSEIAVGIAIPLVLIGAAAGVRHIRKVIENSG